MRKTHVGLLVVIGVMGACSQDPTGTPDGNEGGACFPNGTCNSGLTCASSICVRVPDRGQPDVAKVDMLTTDVPKDLPAKDASAPDRLAPDKLTWPDHSAPDKPAPDVAKPDKFLWPDQSVPDKAAPDLSTWPVPGTWVTVSKGTFVMGSPASEPCRISTETQHQVTLTHGFLIQTTEVTQGQFSSVMSYNPSTDKICGNDCPVETVTWHEAVAYCNTLSSKKGLAQCYTCSGSGSAVSCANATSYADGKIYACPGYRLPTEAEWEYAYRAGTSGALYNGTLSTCQDQDAKADLIAWYTWTSQPGAYVKVRQVAQRSYNLWGLYDMAGNVFEWINDWRIPDLGSTSITDPWGGSTGTYGRILRGGSFSTFAQYLRAAYRQADVPNAQKSNIGFRCVRSL